MNVRYFALVMGVIFLLIGVMGFIPPLVTQPVDETSHHMAVMGPGSGYLLGIFHVNVIHNIIHLIFGIWGLWVARSFRGAKVYARFVAAIYATLAVLGLFPVLNTMFGLVPIHGNDVWLHALIAVAAAYFGLGSATAEEPVGAGAFDRDVPAGSH